MMDHGYMGNYSPGEIIDPSHFDFDEKFSDAHEYEESLNDSYFSEKVGVPKRKMHMCWTSRLHPCLNHRLR